MCAHASGGIDIRLSCIIYSLRLVRKKKDVAYFDSIYGGIKEILAVYPIEIKPILGKSC